MRVRPERHSVSPESLMIIGVPKKFTKYTIEDYKTGDHHPYEVVKEFVTQYIKDIQDNFEEGKGIFFFGSNGVGKSMLSCIILKEAYRKRFTCRRVTFSSYISYYTDTWNTSTQEDKDVTESNFYNEYKGVEFLVLEEVGKEIDSKISKPILEDLLRYREEKGLVTIMCTNLEPKVIEELYGPSIISLIKGNMSPVKIVGKDKRQEVFDS